MPASSSAFYPPRASSWWLLRTGAALWDRGTVRLRRTFDGRPGRGSRISSSDWLLSLLIPGYAYAIYGRRLLASLILASWCGGLLIFLIFLGHPLLSGWGLGILASAHSSGQGFLVTQDWDPESEPMTLGDRIGLPLAFWFGCLVLIYWPSGQLFQTHVARPIFWEGRLLILQAWTRPESLRRGEHVGVRIKARYEGPVRIREGISFGPVLGLPGDRLEFTPETNRANGQILARPPGLLTEGNVEVPANTWYVWPALTARVQNVELNDVNQVYRDMAFVARENLLGRPFAHWFFRPQPLP